MNTLRPVFAIGIAAAMTQAILLTMLVPEGGRISLLDPAIYLFVLGPPLFLALLVWRRRASIVSPRRMLIFTLIVAAVSIVPLANEVIVRQQSQPHGSPVPLIAPLVQWLPVLAWWLSLMVKERRQRRMAG